MSAFNTIFAAIKAAIAGLLAPERQVEKSLSQRLADSVTQSAELLSDCCSNYGTAFARLSTIR